MGKSNRVRTERAAASVSKSSAKNVKKDSSRLYSVIIALVALFVLVTIVVSTIVSSGIIMRSSKAMKTENYTINGNMFKYMVVSGYNSFLSGYSSYLSYFGLDTSKPLADQTYGTGSEATFLGAFEGSWLDYFVSSAKTQADQMLVYCEEADTRGIKLDDTDKEYIDESIALLSDEAQMYGYSLEAYVSLVYGKGVKVKDVRAVMELSALASKAAEAVDKEILDGITDKEIKEKYEADTMKYDVVDYLSYSIGVSFSEVAKEVIDGYDGKAELTDEQKATVLEKYKQRIAEIKVKAEEFREYTDAEAFKLAILKDIADEAFDDLYASEALADADKLSEENLATVKTAMIEKVIAEVLAKEESSDDTAENEGSFTAYEVTLTENAAKAIDDIKADLFNSVDTANGLYDTQKQNYIENEEFPKWAFEEGRNAGDTYIVDAGDGANDVEVKNESGYFSADIYFVEQTKYCDKTASKNVAYMSFASKDAAQKAIDAIKASEKLDLSTFEAIAKEQGAPSSGLLDNYLEGQLSYNGFEAWLYDEYTKIGSYTASPLANAATSATEYAVFFYVEDGDEAWYIDVNNDIFVEDYQAYYEALTEKYPITTNDKVVAKVEL